MNSDRNQNVDEWDRDHLWHPYTSTIDPLPTYKVVSAEGVRLRLADGTALLISTRGAVSGSRYLLDEDEITVGRDPSSDILLDDSTVSRTHAVFRRINGNYSVIDAGSLNGTYVNRQRVDSQELKNGDEIILGKFRLVYFTNKAVIA